MFVDNFYMVYMCIKYDNKLLWVVWLIMNKERCILFCFSDVLIFISVGLYVLVIV